MKHLLQTLALIIAMMLPVAGEAENRVLETPEYIYRNTEAIDVSRLTLADTATVIDIYAKGKSGKTITISEKCYLVDNNGKRYPVRSSVGIELGKPYVITKAGNAIFQLVFPPIDKTATTMSFIEGNDKEWGYAIYGIQVHDGKLPALQLPQGVTETIDATTPLPASVLRYGKATLRGHVLNYLPEMKDMEMTIDLHGIFWQKLSNIDVKSDGTFSVEVDVAETTPAILSIPKGDFIVFLQPGETTEIWLNPREIGRNKSKYHRGKKASGLRMYVNGPLAKVSQEIDFNYLQKHSASPVHDTVAVNMTMAEYKMKVQQALEERCAALYKEPLSLATKQYMELSMQLWSIYETQAASQIISSAYRRKTNCTRDERMKKDWDLRQEAPGNYYVLTDEQRKLLNSTQAALSPTFFHLILANTKAAFDGDGLASQRNEAFMRYMTIKQNYLVLNDTIRKTISRLPQSYQTMIEKVNAEMEKIIAANKLKTGYEICDIPNVEYDSLFNAIIGRYKGKAVVVDFWATWCGPCKQNIENSRQLREDNKDKVAFVFITSESSPKTTWENMIPDISGYHYRVDKGQWRFLSAKFGIEGIPFYVFVDKNGNIVENGILSNV